MAILGDLTYQQILEIAQNILNSNEILGVSAGLNGFDQGEILHMKRNGLMYGLSKSYLVSGDWTVSSDYQKISYGPDFYDTVGTEVEVNRNTSPSTPRVFPELTNPDITPATTTIPLSMTLINFFVIPVRINSTDFINLVEAVSNGESVNALKSLRNTKPIYLNDLMQNITPIYYPKR